jgi:opacity protein-like surface antigen
MTMRKFLQSLLLALAILGTATATFAQDSEAPEQPIVPEDPSRFVEGRLWIGQWSPDTRSDFWDDNFQNFEAGRGDAAGYIFGIDTIQHRGRYNALMLSLSFFSNSINEPARYARDEAGDPIEHHLELYTLSLTAGYVFYPAGTEDPVIPYLGAGAGLYGGYLRSYRDSFATDDCDEDNNCRTEYTDSKDSTFLTFGYFALAGLEVPVSRHMALLAEGRYTVAHAHLGGSFTDHRNLDLSGRQLSAGLAIHF